MPLMAHYKLCELEPICLNLDRSIHLLYHKLTKWLSLLSSFKIGPELRERIENRDCTTLDKLIIDTNWWIEASVVYLDASNVVATYVPIERANWFALECVFMSIFDRCRAFPCFTLHSSSSSSSSS